MAGYPFKERCPWQHPNVEINSTMSCQIFPFGNRQSKVCPPETLQATCLPFSTRSYGTCISQRKVCTMHALTGYREQITEYRRILQQGLIEITRNSQGATNSSKKRRRQLVQLGGKNAYSRLQSIRCKWWISCPPKHDRRSERAYLLLESKCQVLIAWTDFAPGFRKQNRFLCTEIRHTHDRKI